MEVIVIILAAVICLILYKTLKLNYQKVDLTQQPLKPQGNYENEIKHLSDALKIKTVSKTCYEEKTFSPYDEFVDYLEKTYPLFYSKVEFNRINNYGLVYIWKSNETSKDKLPLLFLAHYDVVPVESGTEGDWKYPPFSGEIAEDMIWGRGSLDIKSQVISLIESAQALMTEGFSPKRDIYFAFGNDEEIGGHNGAAYITKHFEESGLKFEAVYDECGFVATSAIKGVNCNVAQIGIAEKGNCNIKISAVGEGGHSAMPPKVTALKNLANAIVVLQENTMKPYLCPPVVQMLKRLCHYRSIGFKMMVANMWLFKPLVIKALTSNKNDNAMVRTTYITTVCHVGSAPNVLSQKAEAIINCRTLPGETSKDIVEHIKSVAGKYLDNVEIMVTREPSEISPIDTKGFEKLEESIEHFFPNAVITPYLVVGGSDSRKYYNVCKNIYRFTPFIVTDREMKAFHNTNESITLDNYKRMIEFYKHFITNFDA